MPFESQWTLERSLTEVRATKNSGGSNVKSKRGFIASNYQDISQDHLLVAALLFLDREGKQRSFENLVAEAFLSFPLRFQLEGYPEWPNAHVIGKSWVRCRTDKKWIAGSAANGFTLTPLGLKVANEVLKKLSVKPANSEAPRLGSRQSIPSRVVLRMEQSSAWQKNTQEGLNAVTEYDFCDLLYSTLESTPEVVEKNFDVVRQEVDAYGRKDLVQFLDRLREKFEFRFSGKRARGGLMSQRKEK